MEISDPWRERAGCFSFIGHQKVLAEQVTHKKKKEKVFLFPISQIFWASIQYERKKELSHIDKEVFWNPIARKIHWNKFPPDVYIHNKRNCVHFVYPFHSSHTDTWPGYCRKQSCSSTQLAMDQVPGYFTSPGLWHSEGVVPAAPLHLVLREARLNRVQFVLGLQHRLHGLDLCR